MQRHTALELRDADDFVERREAYRDRVLDLAELLEQDRDGLTADLEDIEDPRDRAIAAETAMQRAATVYATARELRDEAIREVYAEVTRSEARSVTDDLSDQLMLSEAQLRVIRAAKNRGRYAGQGTGTNPATQHAAETLTRAYLTEARTKRGLSIEAIAKETGTSPLTVRDYLVRHDLPTART